MIFITAGCPQCDQPALVTDRFVLESTDGPIEHLRTLCLTGHRFMLSTDMLTRSAMFANTADSPAAC